MSAGRWNVGLVETILKLLGDSSRPKADSIRHG